MIGITSFGGDAGKSGISQYIIHLLRAYCEAGLDDQFELFTYLDEKKFFVPPLNRYSILRFPDSCRHPVLNVAWHQLILPYWCHNRRYEVLFLPAGNRRVPLWVPCPTVGTVHDFSSLHVANKYDPARKFYITQVLPFLVRKLTRVVTLSESSKRDIVEFAQVSEDRVHVTPLAADTAIFYPVDKEAAFERIQNKYGLRTPFILYISRLEHPGKNHVSLIEAFARLKKQEKIPHQLVLTGSDWIGAEHVHRAAEESGVARDICFTGFVAGSDLPAFYNACDLFVFPSLYEGFGLPVLEAMACGVPVACSNVSSLPEVAGEAALLFDPADPESIQRQLERLIGDPILREDCIRRGLERCKQYSWKDTAMRTWEVLQLAAEEQSSRFIQSSIPVTAIDHKGAERILLINELEKRFGADAGFSRRLRFLRKKYTWIVAIGGARLLKRFLDIAVSIAMLILLTPLFAIVAACIKLTDGGRILFWQTRVGQWGREFPFPKFRSMREDAEKVKAELAAQNVHQTGVTFKMKKDPRITAIGRIIRKLSIDELPQLWCVLKGDMSLVGPRPPIPSEVAQYTLRDRRRLDVIPGLTCIWQISGRSDIPFDKQVELDFQYIDNQSFWEDLKILLKTIPAVLLGRGAY